MEKKTIYFIIALAVFAMAGGCKGREPEGFFLTDHAEVAGSGSGDASQPKGGSEDTTQTGGGPGDDAQAQVIYVQVSGAVAKPGVYELNEGSRIFQAVELAGGLTEEADGSAVNQAAALSDGQMVYIPRQGEEPSQGAASPSAGQADGKVSLNTATEAELMALPGIGEAKARSILAWREQHGGFSQIEDLMKIEGIKDGVFSKIKDSIKVD